jgi:hypothetical protein
MIYFVELGKYVRYADSVSWDFCLARKHGSANAVCTPTCLLALEISLFYCFGGVVID